MKKIIGVLINIVLVVSLTACGGKITPKQAYENTVSAKQGKMIMSLSVTGDKAKAEQKIKITADSVYGISEDNKKNNMELTIKANYMDKALEARINYNIDLSNKDMKFDLQAGVPTSTLTNLGLPAVTPFVISANEGDLKDLTKGQNIDINSTMNAESLTQRVETFSKVITMLQDLKIDEPKDEGVGSAVIEERTFEGEKYTVNLTEDQVKGLAKALVKIGSDIKAAKDKSTKVDADTKTNTALASLNSAEIEKQIDEAFKNIALKDGVKATIIIDKTGYIAYLGVAVNIQNKQDVTNKSEATIDLALGYSDLDSSVKGLEYYEKNKVGMYKNATVIPVKQLLSSFLGGNEKDGGSLGTGILGLDPLDGSGSKQ